MKRIESPSNSKIKLAASLRLKKNRDSLNLFIAEGVRLVETAAQSSQKKIFALVTDEALQKSRVKAIIEKLESENCEVFAVSAEIYKKASATKEPQGILLVTEQKNVSLAELSRDDEFLVVLDEVQDAGNVGSIIRTADACGCSAVILLKGCADAFSDKTVRAAMGSTFHLPIVENVTAGEFIEFCKKREIKIFSAALDEKAQSLFNTKFGNKKALVFGNEGNGVSAEILQASESFYIPMKGKAESLNVSAAAAVSLYAAANL